MLLRRKARAPFRSGIYRLNDGRLRLARLLQEAGCHTLGCLHQRIKRYHFVDESVALRRWGVDHARAQHHLHSPALSNELNQPLGSPVARNQAQRRLGQAQTRRIRSYAHMAGHGQLQAAAQCIAVDGRDIRLFGGGNSVKQETVTIGRQSLPLGFVEGGKFGNVCTGYEALFARARQNDDPNVRLPIQPFHRVMKRLNHLFIQSVQGLLAVNRKGGDAILNRQMQVRKFHRCKLGCFLKDIDHPPLPAMNLKRWIQDKIGIGENRDKLALLEKRIAALATLEQWALPEVLPIPQPLVERAWSDTLSTLDLPEAWGTSPKAIHRSDPMFRYPFQVHGGDAVKVLAEYYGTGAEAAWHLQTIAPKVERILDFGGGYGRVGRFLSAAFPSAKRLVSDPKPSAVDFQIKHFGSLSDDQQPVDLIFAGSVFTHLPEVEFRHTLGLLLGRLTRTGTLVLTLHEFQSQRFAFHPYTEESALRELEDVLSEDVYGSVYCSESFWREALSAVDGSWTYNILPERFGGTQAYLVVKAGQEAQAAPSR